MQPWKEFPSELMRKRGFDKDAHMLIAASFFEMYILLKDLFIFSFYIIK